MNTAKPVKNLKIIYDNLQSVYTLTQISQEALDLCRENDYSCSHITVIMDVILDKFKRTLKEFENIIE